MNTREKIFHFLKFFQVRNFQIFIVDTGEKIEYLVLDEATNKIMEDDVCTVYFQDKNLEVTVLIIPQGDTLDTIFVDIYFNHPQMDTLLDQALDYVRIVADIESRE